MVSPRLFGVFILIRTSLSLECLEGVYERVQLEEDPNNVNYEFCEYSECREDLIPDQYKEWRERPHLLYNRLPICLILINYKNTTGSNCDFRGTSENETSIVSLQVILDPTLASKVLNDSNHFVCAFTANLSFCLCNQDYCNNMEDLKVMLPSNSKHTFADQDNLLNFSQALQFYNGTERENLTNCITSQLSRVDNNSYSKVQVKPKRTVELSVSNLILCSVTITFSAALSVYVTVLLWTKYHRMCYGPKTD